MHSGRLTVAEAGERLGKSRHQIYRLISSQQLPAELHASGKLRYLIDPAEVEAFKAAGQGRGAIGTGARSGAMLRVPDVAAILGFAPETVRRMCERGDLPHVRGTGKAGHFRIPRAAVEEFLNR